MTYWFLTSGNSQRDYSTFFEASTKCYPPPGGIASVSIHPFLPYLDTILGVSMPPVTTTDEDSGSGIAQAHLTK